MKLRFYLRDGLVAQGDGRENFMDPHKSDDGELG
jgi:hypothetical protein